MKQNQMVNFKKNWYAFKGLIGQFLCTKPVEIKGIQQH